MVPEIWSATDRIFLSSWAIFFPFTPLTARKMKISKNKKKTPEDIILHKRTKDHDHRLYCSWDMTRDGCNYFSFWAIFCPFTPQRAQKTKIFKKWKKKLEISSFNTIVPKIMIICFTVPEICCVTERAGKIRFSVARNSVLLKASSEERHKPCNFVLLVTLWGTCVRLIVHQVK